MSLREDGDAPELLSDPADPDGAALAFRRVLAAIRSAERSIVIHMFVWRSDAIGNEIGRAVLDAAGRGVEVHIKKDVGAFLYERIEMNRKSFFNRKVSIGKRLMYALIRRTFPDTTVEDAYTSDLGERLLAHDRITVEWVNHTHTKYYIFDHRIMILGSINIEDRHRGYRDYMVCLSGEDHVRRFEERRTGAALFDPARPVDFLLNDTSVRPKRLEIKEKILELLGAAGESVYIEMAYIGDPDVTEAIIAAAGRGVAVTMLLSRKANIGNDLNYRTAHELFKRSKLEIHLSDTMLHSKLMLFDKETVLMGSANLSVFSMLKAGELDIVVRGYPEFLRALTGTIERRIRESRKVTAADELAGYRRFLAFGQQLHQKLE